MSELTKTMKLHIHADAGDDHLFKEMTEAYRAACDSVSKYVFDNNFVMNSNTLSKALYSGIRTDFGLKSQLTQSVFRTVTARYKTVSEQLASSPYKYKDENGKWQYIPRSLEWLIKPVKFSRPQADLVRNRDYSFVDDGSKLSINTLDKRVKVSFDVPACFEEYFTDKWSFGTAKLVSLNGEWYMHISVTREIPDTFDISSPSQVVGIDRGLRFLVVTYDSKGKSNFVSGKEILDKRETFLNVRAELQAKGTKSAKRRLKAVSGRENRWMSDVNHRLSKTLVTEYGSNTLFVLEDLANVSFDERNLSGRSKKDRGELRSWAFYQLEQFLGYKASENGSQVLKVSPEYTSQRCPKCGRIRKENRDPGKHLYTCDCCGYRSNDDRIAAINIHLLGTMRVSGDSNPRFGSHKEN